MIGADELARIPPEPPRSPSLLPGLALARSFPRRMLALPLFFVAFGALMPLMMFTQDRDLALRYRSTGTATGRVESVATARACSEPDGSALVYSFAAGGGALLRGRATVCPESPYARVAPGDSLPIVYLASDPSVNGIAGEVGRNAPPPFVFLIFPLFFGFMFVPILWPPISQVLRDRKLFKTGSLARGRVVYVRRLNEQSWPGWPAPTRAEVYVATQLRSGPAQEVVATCSNDWLLAHLPPGAEVTLCVRDGRAILLENYLR